MTTHVNSLTVYQNISLFFLPNIGGHAFFSKNIEEFIDYQRALWNNDIECLLNNEKQFYIDGGDSKCRITSQAIIQKKFTLC